MADETKSNPAILIIGVVTFIVAVFFVGNIVAYVHLVLALSSPRHSALSVRPYLREIGAADGDGFGEMPHVRSPG